MHETQRGAKLMSEIFPNHEACIENIFSSLTQSEIVSLIDILKRISKSNLKVKEE